MRVVHIQEAVRARLDANRTRIGHMTPRQVVDTLVWETMVVLGEWQFLDLEVPLGEPDSATDVERPS